MEENKEPVTPTEPKENKDKPQEFTEAEKAEHNLKKKAEEAKKLGLDPKKVLGLEETEVPEWYRKEKEKEVKKTALQMAENISDEDTKTKVKDYLENKIRLSDDPEADFRLALGMASSTKNKQIIEEINRYTVAKTTAGGGSQPAKFEEDFVPTEEEARMMQKPYNLSKEKILAARAKSQK